MATKKRTRSSWEAASFSVDPDLTVLPRSKRRSQRSAKHDTIRVLADEASINGDENAQVVQDKSGSPDLVPAKHGAHGRRIPLSPTKINDHFPASKAHSGKPIAKHVEGVPITPQTTRFRDALSVRLPVTPRHRVGLAGNFATPNTPRTPSTPANSSRTIYNDARRLFTRGTDAVQLVGRDEERRELDSFIHERVRTRRGGCLYVSGPPGTGKSAFVAELAGSLRDEALVKRAYLNCMAVKRANDVFENLATQLGIFRDDDVAEPMVVLERAFLSEQGSTVSYVVVLDEIDQLLGLDLDLLYCLFDWAFHKSSRLVLVGIANALDLTDRFLPKLKARNLKPVLLPFLPYKASQINSILLTRCRSLLDGKPATATDFVPFFHPIALQMISKKVASQNGDLRKAFDIAQRAIEVVEAETREKYTQQARDEQAELNSPSRTVLAENINLASPASSRSSCSASPSKAHMSISTRLSNLNAETAPRATVAHVIRVTSAAFSHGTAQRLEALNLQQKAILCSLVVLEHQRRLDHTLPSTPTSARKGGAFGHRIPPTMTAMPPSPTIREVFEIYSSLCKRDNVLHTLSNTEFRDVVGNLETLSLLAAVNGKASSSFTQPSTPSKRGRGTGLGGMVDERRISASVGLKDLEAAVEGMGSGVLKTLLSFGDALL